MRLTLAAPLLVALLLAAGCGGKPASDPVPPPAPAASSPAPPPPSSLPPTVPPAPGGPTVNPSPPPANPWEGELCSATVSREQRQNRLQTLVAEQVQGRQVRQLISLSRGLFPSCITVEPVGNEEAVLVMGSLSPRTGVMAWSVNGQWRIVPILPPGGDWSFVYSLTPEIVAFPGGNPSLILRAQAAQGDGHQVLLQGRLGKSGALELSVVSDAYRAATLTVLKQDLVLVVQRGPGQEKVAWTCATCQLANHHLLLRWNGERYVKAAERVFHDPYDTVNLFVGALLAPRTEEASRYCSSPSLVVHAQKTMGTLPWSATRSNLVAEIAGLEARNWDALPAELRTPLPKELRTATVEAEYGTERLVFRLVRGEQAWVVDAVERR